MIVNQFCIGQFPGAAQSALQKAIHYPFQKQYKYSVRLKPGVGQYIAIHATLSARDFLLAYFYPFGPLTYIFSKTSPDFSCVGCG